MPKKTLSQWTSEKIIPWQENMSQCPIPLNGNCFVWAMAEYYVFSCFGPKNKDARFKP